ncbi:hypothetical protein BN1723_015939 [Verticillium longisporum]|uniref:Uncharacterized protein n=1 Tax=Verticillium longisporum TaxID=100787 RepID=A0A0G4N4N6_VERLO|nr:hypothetical protein BN1723_015939 [Verticillium longisporum]
MRHRICLVLTALLSVAYSQQPRITAAPEQLAKRQGNVIELHQDYAAPIGVDTNYLTVEGTTTKVRPILASMASSHEVFRMPSKYEKKLTRTTSQWIGVYLDYLTEVTRTTTINNVETTTVVKPQLAVATATKASEGIKAGDVTVLLSDSVQNELDVIIKEAAASCDSAPEILGAAVQVLKTQAQKNKFAIMVAAAGAAGAWAVSEGLEPLVEVAHKFVFGDGLFGNAKDDSAKDGDNGDPITTKAATSTTTGFSCGPSGTVDENSPACDDADCKGKDKFCQADGENKGCPCVYWTKSMIEGLFDKKWSDEQQKILQELEAGLPNVIPPQCFRNTYGDGFDGKPKAEPSAFCHCSSAGAEGGMTRGNFPTLKGEGDMACTYSKMPSQTISITKRPKQTAVTSCRLESSQSSGPYCTCNDDKIHGEIVTTYLGKETTVCPDATATMTGIQDGTPTVEPSCYPTHGPEHSNPELDELIKICNAGKSEFAAVCRSNASRNIEVRCPGRRGPWEPVSNDRYHAWFKFADEAPEDCRYLFGDNGAKNDDAVGARVDALCIPAFEAIKKKCSWNGGEVKNQCGTFVYQSCPLSRWCEPGHPQGS